MNIQKIVLNNFRIYKGSNQLVFKANSDKNIHIISGFNGFGKTTLLSSLVWCLYGKNMQEVDKEFKEAILEAGGYKPFLINNLNRAAKVEGDIEYKVSITFGQLNIPGLIFNDIEISRSFSINKQSEKLNILIDGKENELVNDIGLELFIHDFILPKEVAKFFFFDAEKITALAEMNTIEDKRQLSKAYSEVLGIKKYVDLRTNLQNLRYKYSKASVNPEDKHKVTKLETQKTKLSSKLNEIERKIELLQEEIDVEKAQLRELDVKLIKEGTEHSVGKIVKLEAEKKEYDQRVNELKNNFKELLDLFPLAIAFKQLEKVENQLNQERSRKVQIQDNQLLQTKIDAFSEDINQLILCQEEKSKIEELLGKHFTKGLKKVSEDFEVLHDFNDDEYFKFSNLINTLRNSYLEKFKNISRELKLQKTQQNKVTKKISKLQSKENDKLIRSIRLEQEMAINNLKDLEDKQYILLETKGKLSQELTSCEKVLSELLKKVNLVEGFIEKDQLAERLINKLNNFIENIRSQKRKALEYKIAETLKSLMHKESFIDSIKVELYQDYIDIKIIDTSGREIPRNALSKGEQQLYASAILKSFVDESNIEFPVFVDSPLQKFDAQHACNIIQGFYPHISKQVVIFPLLQKELVEKEYKLMQGHINSAHIIQNINQDASTFIKVEPNNLFQNQQQLTLHV